MPWQLVTKEEAASCIGINQSAVQDIWSEMVEGLIFEDYKHTFGTPTEATELYDGTGTDTLFLRRTPITAFSAVQIDNTTIPISSFSVVGNTLIYPGKFPVGTANISVTYTAGTDTVDPRLKFAELSALAYIWKFYVAERGDDSIKFSNAPSLGTNQYSPRPGLVKKVKEVIRDLVPARVKIGR